MVLKKLTNKLFELKQKNLLAKELKQLEKQYKLTRNFPEYGTSEDDNVMEVERVQENLGLQKNIKNMIRDVKIALRKIEKGKYGICDECHNQIEEGRLKAYPAASLCVTCAAKKFKKNLR